MIVGVLGAIAQNDMKRILSLPHRQPDRLHGARARPLHRRRHRRRDVLHRPPDPGEDAACSSSSGLVEQIGRLDRARPGRWPAPARARSPLPCSSWPPSASPGIPPLSGFVGKLALVDAGFGCQEYVIVGVSLVGSVLTLFSMAKIWNGVFWGVAERPTTAVAQGGHRAPGARPDDRFDDRPGRSHPRHRRVRRAHLRPLPPRRREPAGPDRLRRRGARPMSAPVSATRGVRTTVVATVARSPSSS